MLRSRILLRASRQSRSLHSAGVLRKKTDYKDSFLDAHFVRPTSDPFAAFKEQDYNSDKEAVSQSQEDFGLEDNPFRDENYGFGDLLDDIQPPAKKQPQDDPFSDSNFNVPELDDWYTPKDRYTMRQDVDMTPLRGLSEDLGTHMIPKPSYDPETNSQANYEKIFARVMGEFDGKEKHSKHSQLYSQPSRDYSHDFTRSKMEHLMEASGVEDSPSLDSPYLSLFDSRVPEMFVEICAEPDIEARHSQIDSLDFSNCSETEKVIGQELQKLIHLQSDYELLQFINSKLDVFEELSQSGDLPSELPPLAVGFPLLLNESLQLLVEQFESPAEALALFESVKQRSGKLYFAAVSADVYLSMIRITWEFYRNVGAVAALASDVAMMNLKSRAIVSALTDVEKNCRQLLQMRQERGHRESVGARLQARTLRRFAKVVDFLRHGVVERR